MVAAVTRPVSEMDNRATPIPCQPWRRAISGTSGGSFVGSGSARSAGDSPSTVGSAGALLATVFGMGGDMRGGGPASVAVCGTCRTDCRGAVPGAAAGDGKTLGAGSAGASRAAEANRSGCGQDSGGVGRSLETRGVGRASMVAGWAASLAADSSTADKL